MTIMVEREREIDLLVVDDDVVISVTFEAYDRAMVRTCSNRKERRVFGKGFPGSGRRMCVGITIANRVVHTMLASLLYHFDWKLANGEKDMDMTEKQLRSARLGSDKNERFTSFYLSTLFKLQFFWTDGLKSMI